jgi:hypothetical protein
MKNQMLQNTYRKSTMPPTTAITSTLPISCPLLITTIPYASLTEKRPNGMRSQTFGGWGRGVTRREIDNDEDIILEDRRQEGWLTLGGEFMSQTFEKSVRFFRRNMRYPTKRLVCQFIQRIMQYSMILLGLR